MLIKYINRLVTVDGSRLGFDISGRCSMGWDAKLNSSAVIIKIWFIWLQFSSKAGNRKAVSRGKQIQMGDRLKHYMGTIKDR